MKCKRCGFEWQSYGEALTCPGCGVVTALTQSEKQTWWEEAYEAEKIKDLALRARCYLALAEQGDEKAAYAYGECLRRSFGVLVEARRSVFATAIHIGERRPLHHVDRVKLHAEERLFSQMLGGGESLCLALTGQTDYHVRHHGNAV